MLSVSDGPGAQVNSQVNTAVTAIGVQPGDAVEINGGHAAARDARIGDAINLADQGALVVQVHGDRAQESMTVDRHVALDLIEVAVGVAAVAEIDRGEPKTGVDGSCGVGARRLDVDRVAIAAEVEGFAGDIRELNVPRHAPTDGTAGQGVGPRRRTRLVVDDQLVGGSGSPGDGDVAGDVVQIAAARRPEDDGVVAAARVDGNRPASPTVPATSCRGR